MFVCIEEVVPTKRSKLSPTKRLRVWEKTKGVCVICALKIDGTREAWIAEHVIPLAQGGPDTLENLGPAHLACAKAKTKDDQGRIAKARRGKIKLIGAKEAPRRKIPSRPFPKSPPQRTATTKPKKIVKRRNAQ